MAFDKNFIKENNLTEAVNRLRQINEYIVPHIAEEADELQPDPNAQDPNMGEQDPNAAAQPPMQGGNEQMPAGDPNDMGGVDPNGGDMNADPNAGSEMGMEPQAEPDPTIGAEAPEDPMADGEEEMEGEEGEEGDVAGPDDEVVDVDDLTNSQEAAEYKIDGVDDKLSKLLSIAGKFAKAIEDNEQKINDLKSELEKRNPTDMERINIRSQNSQPFSVNPGAYWDGVRAKNPNYQVVSDNEVAPNEEDKVYTITDDDLKDFNSKEVEKSFDDFPKDLLDYFK